MKGHAIFGYGHGPQRLRFWPRCVSSMREEGLSRITDEAFLPD